MKKRNAARSFFLGIRLTLVTLIASSSALPVATSSANSTSYDAKGGFEIVARYPHDPLAFTQGLEYRNGYLYESTGLNGQSSLRKVDLKTGQVLKKVDVPTQYFAEGLTILGNKIYQLTWQTRIGFIYDLDTFNSIGQFHYDWEGWGLTNDGHYLIMSDGSNKLRFVEPTTFRVARSIDVYSGGAPLRDLNELEYINGLIFANIWHDNRIAKIDPKNGRLLGFLDLASLASGLRLGEEDVLNGIAYDRNSKHLIVTGKRWPVIFVIALTGQTMRRG